jgi:Protein of unknown function (DUF4232)
MTKTSFAFTILVVAAVAVAAGCAGSGAKDAGPVPTGPGSHESTSTGGGTASTSTSSSTGSTSSNSVSSTPLCNQKTASVSAVSQEGAAGTIRTIWRVTNTASTPCRSFGYPGMDFHASRGWLGVEVHRGGFANINRAPAPVVLDPRESMYFVSFWADADTQSGPCQQFDRVKVTLPDNFSSARVTSSGCVDPGLVNVGPVSTSRPA